MDPMTEVDMVKVKDQIKEETKDLRKRLDASGRLVPEKKANKPFFVYQDYQKKQAEMQAEKAERKRVRFDKMARGEDVGPDPDERAPIGNILRLLVILVVTALYAGYFITGDPWWGYESKWLTTRHWKSLIPDGTQKAYTESQLLRYDGTDPEKPILLAIDGTVYDVTEGRRIYGPGGGYHQFAGRDAARAYVTGCFKIHLTHDVRGLTEEEMKSLTKWKDFYANHEKYRKVGTVYHPPIHPSTPIPPPCDSKGDPIIQPQSGPHLPPAASDKSSGEL